MKGGKWYWETRLQGGGHSSINGRDWNVGFAAYPSASKGGDETGIGNRLGKSSNGYGWTHYGLSQKSIYHNSSATAFGSNSDDGDIVGHALDLDNGTWTIYVNGSQVTSGAAVTGIDTSKTWYPAGGANGGTISSHDVLFNFGQDSTFQGAVSAGGNSDGNGFGDFKYSVPSGYLACCTGNLEMSSDIDPAQTNDDYPTKQCGVVAYTGNGSTNAVTGLGFRPDLVIIKNRPGTQGTKITDSSRGVTKVLQAPTSSAESTDSNGLTAFGSDGFTVGSDAGYNGSSNNMVAWCWRANGGTTASNSDGDITSTVQVNQAAGFSIVQYTGVSSATTATVGHGLGKAPEFIIHKSLNASAYHFVRGVPVMIVTGKPAA